MNLQKLKATIIHLNRNNHNQIIQKWDNLMKVNIIVVIAKFLIKKMCKKVNKNI